MLVVWKAALGLLAAVLPCTGQVLLFNHPNGTLSSSKCEGLMTDPETRVGTCCMLVDPFVYDQLDVSFSTSGKWNLREIKLWLGRSIDDIPKTGNSGVVDTKSFPFTKNTKGGTVDPFFNVSLTDYGFGCPDEDAATKFFAVAHATVAEGNGGGMGGKEAWAEGTQGSASGMWWTHTNFEISCPAPSAAPSSTPSARPSTTPSATPSAVPSSTPSARPSTTPSVTPSNEPSVQPSSKPSYQRLADRICGEDNTGPCIESTAYVMFNRIAKFATDNPSASYKSTTSTTFKKLFACTRDDPEDDLPESQHFVWQGFVDYATENANTIYLEDENGEVIEVIDEWGERCENSAGCSVPADIRYQECADKRTCVPETLEYPFEDGMTVLDIDIYEPCNFVSNLAYYRVMPQLCGTNFYMDHETSFALNHAFGALAAGSALWHASHTYLGYQADNQLIAVVAFLVHQMIIGGFAKANVFLNVDVLMYLQTEPRSRTAVQVASDITDILTSRPVSEWPQKLIDLDIPEYRTAFVVIAASIISILFPEKDTTALLNGMADALGGNSDELNDLYLPILSDVAENLNLSNQQKFTLFRQLVGMFCKMIFAFLWQERVIEIDFFLQAKTNAQAPEIMPPLVSLFNFITGFKHVDEDFQKFNGVYPGDEICRGTVPHSKWHELSAGALLDMVYLADCVAAVVTGSDGSGCAHLSSLDGLGEITRAEISDWIDENISIPNVPIVKDIVPLFIEEIFLLFDVNNNNRITWSDITTLIDTAEDIVTKIIDTIEDFMSRFANFCTADSDCSTSDEFCNTILFGCRPKRENGFSPCLKDSQCYSDRCTDLPPRECRSKLSNGSDCLVDKECESGVCALPGKCGDRCSDNDDCEEDDTWCHTAYTPKICRPQKDNGYFPCIADSQCKSGRCADVGRFCRAA